MVQAGAKQMGRAKTAVVGTRLAALETDGSAHAASVRQSFSPLNMRASVRGPIHAGIGQMALP
jgi:hypothetical protein